MTNASLIRTFIRRITSALLLILVATLLASIDAMAQTVVNRARIGGYAEDITFVGSGALKDHIVMINGFEVMAAPNAKKAKDPLTSIFSLKIPELDVLPTGFAYIESEGLFVFASDTNFKKLYLFDSTGVFKGTRNIQYLNPSYTPQHFEGMGYIPSSSPVVPDHLVVVVWDDLIGGASRIEIMSRTGVVVAELANPAWPPEFSGNMGDVAYLAPDRLLVTAYDAGIWTMDFSGNIISGPVPPGNGVGEGIVQMSDTRIVATNFPQNLLFFDSNLNRQPESDRNDIIGLNLNVPNGVAWNPDTNMLLLTHNMPGLYANAPSGISSVPTSLDSATQVVDTTAFQFGRFLTYLPAENLIAMAHANPRKIVLFNSNSTFNSEIDLSSPTTPAPGLGPIAGLAYIPTTNEFAVSFNGAASNPDRATVRRTLYILSRTGALVRTLDLTNTGTGGIGSLTYYVDPGGNERFMILSGAGRVIITDLDGNSRNNGGTGFPIGEFNSRVKLALTERADIAAITTGPMAGAFAIVSGRTGEVVIFRLD